MPTLEKAIALAARAHEGQTDKAGAPYILHPLRVMFRVSRDEGRMAAVLHDVVEDSDVTLEDQGPQAVVEAVDTSPGGPASLMRTSSTGSGQIPWPVPLTSRIYRTTWTRAVFYSTNFKII